ncbi:hypothetical protein BC937DRAFT_86760 [Endogone sp. FLAS-F59071]|nr:hypothetical protein BC937DRAFT_86760 [Endogone sp. FLAS-F59071]|eukprot:RUS22803.1 hypothetical protein BC937DRAFT_86760 [Endogone sp. FLAS-F59071]
MVAPSPRITQALQPYFGNQVFNTAKPVSAGVALRINHQSSTATDVADLIRCLMEDANSQFAANIKRMKAGNYLYFVLFVELGGLVYGGWKGSVCGENVASRGLRAYKSGLADCN